MGARTSFPTLSFCPHSCQLRVLAWHLPRGPSLGQGDPDVCLTPGFLAGIGVYVFLCLHVCIQAQGAVTDGMDGSVDNGIDSLPPTPGCDGQYWHRCTHITSLEQCPWGHQGDKCQGMEQSRVWSSWRPLELHGGDVFPSMHSEGHLSSFSHQHYF